MMVPLTFLCALVSTINHHNVYVDALEKHELYPFGAGVGDNKLPSVNQPKDEDDVSSTEVKLTTNIKFYSSEYDAIYVSTYQM